MNNNLLKTLCNQLPYGLKLQTQGSEIGLLTCIDLYCNEIELEGEEDNMLRLSWGEYKPILRDLSDSREEIRMLLNIHIEADLDFVIENPLNFNYNELEKLIKNHYNVFGLKPNEYINVKDLETNPYK